MGYYIFDLDGTLANIDHRLHFLEKNDWDGFFEACDQDEPVEDVIQVMLDLASSGHHVEIWSGRSKKVCTKTFNWLDKYCSIGEEDDFIYGSDLLTHMRLEDDHRKDTTLKEEWLHKFHQEYGFFPTMIFDDRPSVVEMWRKNGVTCAQVATWDDRKRTIQPYNPKEPRLFIMIGPSGAGKSSYVRDRFRPTEIVSSDEIREELCGNFKSQERNKDVFQALNAIAETRLKNGLRVVIDATSLRAKRRKEYVAMARNIDPDMKIKYVVVDRPLEEKFETAGWRENITVGDDEKSLIQYHHDIFQQNLKQILNGDGLGVQVEDTRKENAR